MSSAFNLYATILSLTKNILFIVFSGSFIVSSIYLLNENNLLLILCFFIGLLIFFALSN